MLDFTKLLQQIGQMQPDTLVLSEDSDSTLRNAYEAFLGACKDPDKMWSKLLESEGRTNWPLAIPLEPFGEYQVVTPLEGPHTVVATDGSQIMPSHHEVYSCYLINIGVTTFSYGVILPPLLETIPYLFHETTQLYPLMDGKRVHVDEVYVSFERNVAELKQLGEYALRAKERGLPVVAFTDGSLIAWGLDRLPHEYQLNYQTTYISVMESLKAARIPIIGYISHSRSADIIHALRVWVCPYTVSACSSHCGHLSEVDFPCSTIWPSTDRQIIGADLTRHQRTALFSSGVDASRSLPRSQQICFTYMSIGQEVARVEMPRWVAEDNALRELALGAALSQAQKGHGYPVSLAEAHNLAVIRAADRARFFELVARHLISLGVEGVRTSPKESRKRRGII